MALKIFISEGSTPSTAGVELSNAETHIKARDRFANEAEILLAYSRILDLFDREPIAWKWNYPTEGARFVYSEVDYRELMAADPSLVVRLQIVVQDGAVTEDQIKILGEISTRDESGVHFTEKYNDEDIAALERAGLIDIHRPVHEATGISYGQTDWSVLVTEYGLVVVESNQ